MKRLKLDQFLDYRCLSAVRHAPGGGKAAFVITKCSDDEQGYTHELWLCQGGTTKCLSSLLPGNTYWWENDRYLLVPNCRIEDRREEEDEFTTVFYRIDVNTGRAERAFETPFPALDIQRIDDTHWAVLGKLDANAPELYLLKGDERRSAVARLREEAEHYQVVDELPFYYNGIGMVNKQRSALFLFDMTSGSYKRITNRLFHVSGFACVGSKLFYSGKSYSSKMPRREALLVYDLDTESENYITPEDSFYFSNLCAAGDSLVLQATTGERYDYWESADFYVIDSRTCEMKLLCPNELRTRVTLSRDGHFWHEQGLQYANGALYYVAMARTGAYLYALDLEGRRRQVTAQLGDIVSFSISAATGEILLAAAFEMRLDELYRIPENVCGPCAAERMTDFNTASLQDVYVARPEKLSVHTQGYDIDGWVLKPFDYDPSKTYPAVFEVHGGPLSLYGEYFYHEMQLLANSGYFVFYCNPFGSDGRGDEFADLRGRFGEIDYLQLMDFSDAVLERYPQIDRTRIGITGGSYGGFLMNWVIGHTDRFACCISQNSISNWISFYGTADIGTIYAPCHQAADIFDGAEQMWAHSAMKYVKNIQTPTLFLHSMEDGCAPLSEAMQMYSAMADRGVPARLFIFKQENHEISRRGMPMHRVRRLEEMMNWLQIYTSFHQNSSKERLG